MKFIFTIPILIFVISCKNPEPKIEPKELIGCWKMRDVVDQTGKNATEKTTFYNGDSLTIEMFENKKLFEKQRAVYNFDTITKTIHIEAPKSGKLDFKVLKLTSSEMELFNSKQKKLIRFIRAE